MWWHTLPLCMTRTCRNWTWEPILSLMGLRFPSHCRAYGTHIRLWDMRPYRGARSFPGTFAATLIFIHFIAFYDQNFVLRRMSSPIRLMELSAFERKMLRRILGPVCVEGGRPQGQRRRGRPKLRWQDGVEASAIKAGVTDWQTKARDRERFRTLLKVGQDRKAVLAPDK